MSEFGTFSDLEFKELMVFLFRIGYYPESWLWYRP